MRATALMKALVLAGLCSASAFAVESVPVEGRFAVGMTGVLCVAEPCPWLGIVELDNEQRDPLRPLWTSRSLPDLVASEEDTARIEAAWEAMQCVEVQGAFAEGRLRVDHVIGDCQ